LAFLAYKVATLPFFAQPKAEATQPAAIEAAPESKQAALAEQATVPAPKVELSAPPPPEPPPPPPSAKAAPAPEKPEPPQVIVPRTKVARLDIVGKQVQDKKLADAETERNLQDEKDALAKAEQERLQKEKDAVVALAEQEKKQAEKLALDAEAAVRKQKERDEAEAAARKQKEKEEAEAAVRKQKDKEDAELAARKQKEKEEAEAAVRKQKEKEEAARKYRERQRKEQEDRIKKMAKEFENKEQTEDQKKRIAQAAGVELRASETDSKLATKISDKYAASIQAAIRPNITFDADSVSGNPAVEIQVGLRPDGTIFNATIVKTSGVRSWDTAAARALEKTERLPKEEDGRTPSTLLITLRPRER